MRGDVIQYFAEVRKFLGSMFLAGAVEFFNERLHAVEAGFVERLKNVERGEEKSTGAAGRIKDGDVYDRLPQGAEQFGAFAVLNHVLGKLSNVEVESNEFVDIADF